jgi:hypothetical protein
MLPEFALLARQTRVVHGREVGRGTGRTRSVEQIQVGKVSWAEVQGERGEGGKETHGAKETGLGLSPEYMGGGCWTPE